MAPVWTLPPPIQLPQPLQWELLEKPVLPILAEPSPTTKFEPLTAEEIDAVINRIPLQPEDYEALLRLSPVVPTTFTLPPNQWRMQFTNISPFDVGVAGGTGNQNYSVNLDVGFSSSLLLSAFVSQADDPLSALIKGSDRPTANFWQSYGAGVRWRWLQQGDWAAAFNGSLEVWEVISGGSVAFTSSAGDNRSNIFNDSGERVSTQNLVGSMNVSFSWRPSADWQFYLVPGVSFLPAEQGAGQGGAGQFYGNNLFISGGVLFQPIPELALNATVAQPIGSGTNNFDSDLVFSRVPIFSAGLNWDLNPRIGFRGLLTNGFGVTPATALLTLPSSNRLGYNVSFVFTADAPDTPQVPLTKRQRSLAKGGFTVNTALVPSDDETDLWMNAESLGNVGGLFGYSLSNIFQLQLGGVFYDSAFDTPLQTNDGFFSWRIGGKAVVFSPLRGAPFWGAARISLGRNNDLFNNAGQDNAGLGYVFAESMVTWEANSNLAFNLNPKLVISSAGELWGLGISSNFQLAPGWQIIAEANAVVSNLISLDELIVDRNLVIDSSFQTNGTIGLRCQINDGFAVEAYGSTAASLLDAGQLFTSNQFRWGSRLILSF